MRTGLIGLMLLMAVAVSAQTPERSIDLSALGWGALATPESIDTDGHPETIEWLILSAETNQYRVVAERGGGLCAGPWFNPRPHPFSAVSLQRLGRVHKLIVRPPSGPLVIWTLHTPC